MGVQCTVLGHAYGGTESEEHREDRDDGTVLISREYQVCTRCGNRKELYRNEQLLPNQNRATDSAADGANNESHDTQTAVEPPAEETPTGSASGPAVHSPDAVEAGPDPAPAADEGAGGVILEADGNGDPSDPQTVADTAADVDDAETDRLEHTESADDAQSTDATGRAGPDDRGFGEWPQEATGSTGSEHQPTSSTVTDETSGTEDAVILSGSSESSSQAETDDSAQRSARTETADEWPTSTESTRTETTDTDHSLRGASETVSELSAFDTDEPTDPEIQCPTCESGWARAETSLRDGDLCPDCREGYVEVR